MFILSVLTLLSVVFASSARFRTRLNDLFSAAVHAYLIRRYPIRHVNDPRRAIPTVPYRFPNGQGDVAKFLEGEKNSVQWAKEHGRVYRLWNGTTPEIVISTPTDVRTVFRDSDKHTKAINNNAGWLMGQLLGQCLGLISGHAYTSLRAATSPPFTHKMAPGYLDRMSRITAARFTSISSAPNGNLRKGVINPVADLRSLPFWILADVLYGSLSPQLKTELQSLTELRESLWKRMIKGGMTRFSFSQYLPTEARSNLGEFKSRWKEFNDKAYQACLMAAMGHSVPIVSLYMHVKRASIEMEEILQTLDEMLFANLDVTIGALSWNLMCLAAHPEVQGQVRAEIQRARKGEDQTWAEYLAISSTFLHASILESSRLKPLAAFTVPQAAPTDRVVGDGYRIPKGTNMVVDTWALNIANTFWGQDGHVYRPSRFLEREASKMRYEFWRFGFGPRQCLGRYLVDLLLRVVVAHLVENYELGLLEDATKWEKDEGSWITHPHPDTELRCRPISGSVG